MSTTVHYPEAFLQNDMICSIDKLDYMYSRTKSSSERLKVPMNQKLFFFSFKICLAKCMFPKFEKSRLDDFTSLQIRSFLPSKMVFESRSQITT